MSEIKFATVLIMYKMRSGRDELHVRFALCSSLKTMFLFESLGMENSFFISLYHISNILSFISFFDKGRASKIARCKKENPLLSRKQGRNVNISFQNRAFCGLREPCR